MYPNWTKYNVHGQSIEQRTIAGDIIQIATTKYDSLGRIAESKDRSEYRTQYQFANNPEEVDTTILPGGATRISARYLDGRQKSLTGTAVVHAYYDYGVEPETHETWSETRQARKNGPRWSRNYTNFLGQSARSTRPGVKGETEVASRQRYDSVGRLIGNEAHLLFVVPPSGGKAPHVQSAPHRVNAELQTQPLGSPSLIVYDEHGEVSLTGLDIDGSGILEQASNDRLSRTETDYEQDESGHWWRIAKTWTWPKSNDATKVLVSEARTRVTGHPENSDEKLGRLMSETIQSNTGLQPVTTLSYLNRETGQTTTIQRKPNLEVVTVSVAGLVQSVTERQIGEEAVKAPSTKNNQRVVYHQYDALGRRIASIDPRTGKTTAEYDPKTGQISKTTDADGNATTYAYYGPEEPNAGKLKSLTNALGKTQKIFYNTRGQKTATRGETDYHTDWVYDEYGQMVAMRTYRQKSWDPAKGEDLLAMFAPDVTRWVHDEATGVLLEKIYADGQGPTYEYHPDGRMKTRTWARGLVTHYEYDPQTLAQAKTWYSDAEGNPIQENHSAPIILQHNRAGQVIAIEDTQGRRTFERDAFGREIAEILPNGQRIERDYADDSGLLAVVELSESDQAENADPVYQADYSYNPNGTLAAVSGGENRFEYGYVEGAPNLLASLKGPVAQTTYGYEQNRNLITKVKNVAAASSRPVSQFTYRNDQIGRRVEVAMEGENLENSGWQWAYNDRSELVSADPANPDLGTYAYQFNGLGNRETATEGHKTTVYQTNALNQYTTIESKPEEPSHVSPSHLPTAADTPTYDADGNTLSDGSQAYSWNANNRLVRVEKKWVQILIFQAKTPVSSEILLKNAEYFGFVRIFSGAAGITS